LPGDRFQTATRFPLSVSVRAMTVPIAPSPRTDTSKSELPLFCSRKTYPPKARAGYAKQSSHATLRASSFLQARKMIANIFDKYRICTECLPGAIFS
jgi:D-alanyl-D-alanine dipeptidase